MHIFKIILLFFSEIPKIKRLTEEFQSQNIFISHFESWYPEFEGYVNENFLPDNYKLPGAAKNISQQFFNEKITQYLFSPRGAKFKSDFVFDNATTLKCGDPAPKIQVLKKGILLTFQTCKLKQMSFELFGRCPL